MLIGIIGTCKCGMLGHGAGIVSRCNNITVFSFVTASYNKKLCAISGCPKPAPLILPISQIYKSLDSNELLLRWMESKIHFVFQEINVRVLPLLKFSRKHNSDKYYNIFLFISEYISEMV